MTSRGGEQERKLARAWGVCQRATEERLVERKRKKLKDIKINKLSHSHSPSLSLFLQVGLFDSPALVLVSPPEQCPWIVNSLGASGTAATEQGSKVRTHRQQKRYFCFFFIQQNT